VQRVAPAGENPDIWPVSKFIISSLPLCGNPAGKKAPHFRMAGRRYTIFPELCMVIIARRFH